MTTAIIITDTSVTKKTFDVGVTHSEIHEMVGGWFDCVRTDTLIGYVHDTGLIEDTPSTPSLPLCSGVFSAELVSCSAQ